MWLYVLVITLTITYFFLRRGMTYWKKLGVPGPDPLPIVGNVLQNFIGRKHMTEIFADIYAKHKQYPFVGIYRGDTPCLLVRDAGIIKNVLIKDFKYFPNNDVFIDKETDPLVSRNPFVLKDSEWKASRQEIMPAFSSAKIKAMFPSVEAVSRKLVKHIEDEIALSSAGYGLDAKELCTKFTCDNVALCAFGVEGRCFDEPNSEFRQLARDFISADNLQGLKFGLSLIAPRLSFLFSMKLLGKRVEKQMMEIVSRTLEYRKTNKITRSDYLDFVSQLPSSANSLLEITAHVANFFIDGFETSSSAMAMSLLELAMNPECQAKAREEINDVLKNDNGELSYESLQKMTYLDACVNESLRKHPALPSLNRTCSERYQMETIGPEYEKLSVTVEPETTVIIPVLGMHMDRRYFPEPQKFIPERFLTKDNNYKYLYLPFGDGPRSCIGQRFGLLQIKVGLAQLLRNFQFSLNEKTQFPLKYFPFYILLFPKGGIWLNFRKI